MARNIFLDGNTFISGGPSVSKNIFVGDLIVGAEIFAQSGERLSFSLTQRSQEFKNQPGGGDLFGSIEGGCFQNLPRSSCRALRRRRPVRWQRAQQDRE